MRRMMSLGVALMCAGLTMSAQAPDKQLVATISGKALAGGIVSALAWDGGTLIIQTVAVQKDGTRAPGYMTVAGPRMQVESAREAPPGAERYWTMKSNRVSPTGLGKIVLKSDTKLPMYGIAGQTTRFNDALDMGGTQTNHELRLGDLLLHRRFGTAPYDGEVWGWSPPDVNRIVYVDEKGDLWVAQADGRGAECLLKGKFTLPAWSEDGLLIAVAERKSDGAKWEISVVNLPERYRKQQ